MCFTLLRTGKIEMCRCIPSLSPMVARNFESQGKLVHLLWEHCPFAARETFWQRRTLSELVDYFSRELNHPLLDQTGLGGRYDFTLEWAPEATPGIPGPSLLTALEQQLGLKLAEGTASVEFLVIDNVAKPSEN